MSKRKSSVAGAFYPAECSKIKEYIEHFNSSINKEALKEIDVNTRAVIVPHAGYVYSGFTANVAYMVASSRIDIKRVVVIGPSHRVAFKGASVALFDTYESPCGYLAIDKKFSKRLQESYKSINFFENSHQEHSTEVQIPFIQHYFSSTPIVEIVYGDIEPDELATIMEDILQDSSNLLVISTDLSHFYTQKEAKQLDSICIKAVADMDIDMLDRGCEACGMIGIKAILKAAKNKALKTEILDYRTSADASGDDSRVVGYLSALITQP